MEYVSGSQTNGMPIPPGVTAITDLKNQKRASKTLSKAASSIKNVDNNINHGRTSVHR